MSVGLPRVPGTRRVYYYSANFFLPDITRVPELKKIIIYVHATFIQLKFTLSVLINICKFVQQRQIRIESKNDDTVSLPM